MIHKETLGHTWSAHGPSTSMDEHNCSPQLSVLSRRLVYTYMHSIKQDIFSLDLLVCDGHQTLKTDNSRVDNVDSMAQTQRVGNISLQNNKVSIQRTELTSLWFWNAACMIFLVHWQEEQMQTHWKREKSSRRQWIRIISSCPWVLAIVVPSWTKFIRTGKSKSSFNTSLQKQMILY